MIGWEFPPHNSGGLGVACAGLTRGLASLGHQIVFTLPQSMPAGVSYQSMNFVHADGKKMQMIHVNSSLQPYLQKQRHWEKQFESHVQQYYTDMVEEAQKYGDTVAELAGQHEHEIIHAHDWMSIPAGVKSKKKTGKPLVVHIHSTEYDRSGGHRPQSNIADIEYQGMDAADRVVTVSHYTKRLLQEHYSIPESKIDVVHNGIDPNPEFHHNVLTDFLHNRPLIVFVGRLTIQKGPEYFLSVAKEVIHKQPDAVFVLAGHGDMYQSLLVSAAEQGLSGSVLFAGFLRGKEKTQLFRRANVFVMPSVSEPFGIVALEAALERTPVVVSKTSGVSEVLPHAVPVDFWDVHKMRDAILSLITDTNTHGEHVEAGLYHAQNLTWEKAAGEMNKVYQGLTS